MSTTLTIVDPFKGTLVVETDHDIEIFMGSATSVKVGGIDQAAVQEAPGDQTIIRTPAPEHQSLTVTTQAGETLPQESQPEPVQEAPGEPTAEKEATVQIKPLKPAKRALKAKSSIEKVCHNCKESFTAAGTGMHKRKHCDQCRGLVNPADPSMNSRYQPGPVPEIPGPTPKPTPESRQTTANDPLPEGMWWCVHCQGQAHHKSPDCPAVAHNHPASIAREDEERRATDKEAAAFKDPWNCGRCRTDGRVCRFHRGMEASGNEAPANAHQL